MTKTPTTPRHIPEYSVSGAPHLPDPVPPLHLDWHTRPCLPTIWNPQPFRVPGSHRALSALPVPRRNVSPKKPRHGPRPPPPRCCARCPPPPRSCCPRCPTSSATAEENRGLSASQDPERHPEPQFPRQVPVGKKIPRRTSGSLLQAIASPRSSAYAGSTSRSGPASPRPTAANPLTDHCPPEASAPAARHTTPSWPERPLARTAALASPNARLSGPAPRAASWSRHLGSG